MVQEGLTLRRHVPPEEVDEDLVRETLRAVAGAG